MTWSWSVSTVPLYKWTIRELRIMVCSKYNFTASVVCVFITFKADLLNIWSNYNKIKKMKETGSNSRFGVLHKRCLKPRFTVCAQPTTSTHSKVCYQMLLGQTGKTRLPLCLESFRSQADNRRAFPFWAYGQTGTEILKAHDGWTMTLYSLCRKWRPQPTFSREGFSLPLSKSA